jgi:hypothetical protein
MKLQKKELKWTSPVSGQLKGSIWGFTLTINYPFACIEDYDDKRFRLVTFKNRNIDKDKEYKTLRGAKIAANRFHMEFVKEMVKTVLMHTTTNVISVVDVTGKTSVVRKPKFKQLSL